MKEGLSFEYCEEGMAAFPEKSGEELLREQLADLELEDNSEDEGIEDYHVGGYHPVHVGELLHKRYLVIQKLGWGHFSTVWLCRDYKHRNYVAVKVQKSSPHYMEAAFDEVEILQRVAKEVPKGTGKADTPVVHMLNSFVHKSPYGAHFCMVFEILSCNLLEVIKRYSYQGIPINFVREITKQCLQGLQFLHEKCEVIHTDLKPENVLLCLTDE
jgi:serine/threonine-protein kinase SRPK3